MLLNGVDAGVTWSGVSGSPSPDAGPMTLTFKDAPLWIGVDGFGDKLLADLADCWMAPGVSLLDESGNIPLATVRKLLMLMASPPTL